MARSAACPRAPSVSKDGEAGAAVGYSRDRNRPPALITLCDDGRHGLPTATLAPVRDRYSMRRRVEPGLLPGITSSPRASLPASIRGQFASSLVWAPCSSLHRPSLLPKISRGSEPRAGVRDALNLAVARRWVGPVDAATWHALDRLAKDRMETIQELAEEAFRDLLKKHRRPTTLKEMLRESLCSHPAKRWCAFRALPNWRVQQGS